MVNKRKILLGISLGIIVVYSLIALAAPLLTPYSPLKSVGPPLEPPNPDHPLGTDDLGRDIAAGLIYGTRFTLIVGFAGAAIAVAISTVAGIALGYTGGRTDEICSRVIDVTMAIPQFPLLLVLTLFFTPGLVLIALIMGVLAGIHGIRLIRSQVLSLSREPFIEGVRGLGAGGAYIMRHHIFPALGPLLSVKFVSTAQHFMVIGVGLGFLGLIDPNVTDWGQMISRATQYGGFSLGLWWWLVPPGIAITVISIALGLLGTGTEEMNNPRLTLARM